ncbi:hydroxyethylthiazole kinase [Prosthecomicrobium hirschii]|uniref:hydroxyethylthiazole kinase n=1 Tax=Prosthecodimorpha hirschii TaxID=665126 RepID=UPI002220612E|nr:hydroxyethylthiazole kinase [Prosthecomicrobium hirschii]MCW1840334.1 hydroxyethylthiazole kinase [Prosthecomicrobium hirschii]
MTAPTTSPTTAPTIAGVAATLAALRARRPLVHNITNYVAMTVSANVLLSLGASPAMVHAGEEVEDFAGIADALVINIGTLSGPWIEAMLRAAAAADRLAKPWLLDPVAAGATRLRSDTALALLRLKPVVVRGNAGEIMALADLAGAAAAADAEASRGVDSLAGSEAAVAAAVALARQAGTVVALTGATDYVTDGTRLIAIAGGHALMPLSTALGCALSAATGAFLAVAPPFEAAVAALAVYGAAGAVAGARCPGGAGHLPAELCDALLAMDEATLAAQAGLTEIAL